MKRRLIDYELVNITHMSKSMWLDLLKKYSAKGYELLGGPFYDGAEDTLLQAMVLYNEPQNRVVHTEIRQIGGLQS